MEKQNTFQFKAEMGPLLHLLANSLYTQKEIFIRELVSNAADALKKFHFLSLTDEKLSEDEELKISINFDEKNRTFSITDNGVGMTKEELIDNIGTIAKSGTSKFIEKLTGDKKKDAALIGQFGVGFYSVFMVTDEVSVETRSYKEKQGYLWKSNGKENFTIEEIEKKQQGTTISFVIKKDIEEITSLWKIEETLKKYSNFISFPIEVNGEKKNKEKALWTREKKDVTAEEYKEFFQFLSYQQDEPLFSLHYNVEAPYQFDAVIFIPQDKKQQLFHTQLESQLHLYVKRVFIQDDCKDILPNWLRFVYGVVDSQDLPLNISREVTQSSPIFKQINKYLVGKIMSEVKKLARNDKVKFKSFWENFSYFFKEGIYNDFTNKEKLTELYHCYSSHSIDELTTLNEVVERADKEQKEIYYHYTKNKEAAEYAPNLEYFRKNNIEVLYLLDEVDELIMPMIGKYKDKLLVSVDKAKIESSSQEDNKTDLTIEKKKNIIQYFKDLLENKIEDVKESVRLIDSPCTLVSGENALDMQQERMMKSMNPDFVESKKILEINTKNPLIHNLSSIQSSFPQDKALQQIIFQLYDNCLLLVSRMDGGSEMAARSNKMLLEFSNLYLQNMATHKK